MIKPTVGRKVWYWPHPIHDAAMNIVDDQQPLDATVLCAHGDDRISVQVIDHRGHTHFIAYCFLSQPENNTNPADAGYCEWMPYQVGQSQK